jgi:adenosine deaminase
VESALPSIDTALSDVRAPCGKPLRSPLPNRVTILLGAGLLAACATSGGPAPIAVAPSGGDEPRTADYLEAIRDTPPLLGAFLRRMPKGGDLHNHLSGAIYAESYIAWAAADELCVDKKALALAAAPCAPPDTIPAAQVYRSGKLYAALIDALSMRDFVPGAESGHDHFFATFAKFGAAGERRGGDMLAEAAERAGEEGVSYLELMASPGMGAARKLGAAAGWDDDLGRMRDKMLAAGLAEIVSAVTRDLDGVAAAMRRSLGCGTGAGKPGCGVTVRWLAQVIRTFPREQVFAQSLLAFELAKAEPRIVGLNLVAPEDDPVTLRDYAQQMRILEFLGKLYPQVRLSLHAGELAPGLVPPEQLRFHIRGAVETAGARRIGHGVDLLYEDDPWSLLKEMAERQVMVEINLTSNDLILGVSGDRHPFATYRRFGVPLALSTDDEGVSRGDLTQEYQRAALTYHLGYVELKTLARNSLEYAFLPGDSLWRATAPFAPHEVCTGALGGTDPAPSCRDFLAQSEKARAQWRLEAEFAAFEAMGWGQR